jgi:hypothetical protein
MALRVLFLIHLLILVSGCVNSKAIEYLAVEIAKGEEVLNAALEFCGGLGELTQNCDSWKGANLVIDLNGRKMRIAGNSDGSVILVMHDQDVCSVFEEYCLTPESNANYKAIEAELTGNGLEVLRVNPVAAAKHIAGYKITVTGDGYSTLKSYAIP